jgi:uncharacterized membrane protein
VSQNYYEILGVERDADISTIQTAAEARLQALKLLMHEKRMPEANARAEAQELKKIFALLKDPLQRQNYDNTLPPLVKEISEENPYLAPSVDLDEKRPSRNSGGTIEDAILGQYQLNFMEMFAQTWELTYGVKRHIWLGLAVIWIILIGIIALVTSTITSSGETEMVLMQVLQLLINILSYPLTAGLMMIGIRRAAELDFSFMEIFNYFSYTFKLLVATLIMSAFIAVPLLLALGLSENTPFAALLALPALYLFPAYFFTFPLITEKNMGIWDALEVSRQAVTRHWFSVTLIYLAMLVLVFISIIPFGLGLIWTVPMMFALHGAMYRTIFGVSMDEAKR